MGGAQAAKVLAQIQESTLKKQGKEISEEEHKKFLDKISKNIRNKPKQLMLQPDYGQMLLSIL
jgi:serine/threonine protein phosphatase PrpC